MKTVSVYEYANAVAAEINRAGTEFGYVTEAAIAGIEFIDAEVAYRECVARVRGDYYAEEANDKAEATEKKSNLWQKIKQAFKNLIEKVKSWFENNGMINNLLQKYKTWLVKDPKIGDYKVKCFTAAQIKDAAEKNGRFVMNIGQANEIPIKQAVETYAQLKGLITTFTKKMNELDPNKEEYYAKQAFEGATGALKMVRESIGSINKGIAEARKAAKGKTESANNSITLPRLSFDHSR